MRARRQGVSIIEGVGIMVLVTAALIAVLQYIKNPGWFPSYSLEDRQLREIIKKERAEAPLVIIGRITNKSTDYEERVSDGNPSILGMDYWEFNVESVERGYYPHSKISVYFGWKYSLNPPGEYPWGTKTDYKVGDRVKAFLTYGNPSQGGVGPDQPCYFTLLAYLSLEPVKQK